ncbi:hypothetical protein SV7mr_39350 [Stieleria bergensis]|uniref:Endonuclease/exonuclease/phosphatase domain-containing protein n=1 Tax=Stieleria bergensis TaxID=2528025 RepID=A0A517SZ40_9BACT|nr:hypothetical protein SV7mr_39350 [Planctomycetes bacterium SV_7m_r]
MIARWSRRWRALRRWSSRSELAVRWLGLPVSDVQRDHDGLIMIQIDGLSRRELENAIEQGRMPFLKSLLDRQGYRLHSFYSGLPSSTPAVQGELFYGIKTAVPAFGFVDHETNQSVLMFSPDAAAKVQKRISDGKIGLLHGGSSYCNIYDGGANESHFCAASIGWDQILRAIRPSRLAVVAIGYWFSLVRAAGLVFIEIWLGLFDFLRRAITGRELWQELLMIVSRVMVAIGLRELTIISASMDAARGLPIIHLNLLGYDEHAHRRGPSSRFARWTLKGIDRCIGRLASAANLSGRRDYDVWVYSDHGQETTTTYEALVGNSIQDACQSAVGNHRRLSVDDEHGWSNQRVGRAQWLSAGGLVAQLFGTSLPDRNDSQTVRVADCGPLGLLYCETPMTCQQRLQVASSLVHEHQVPMVIVRQPGPSALAITSGGQYNLPQESTKLFGDDHPFADEVSTDLVRVSHHRDSGEMVLSGWCPDRCPVSFAIQAGAHAGPGPIETHGFALLPSDAPVNSPKSFLRPKDLRATAMRFRDGQQNVVSRHSVTPEAGTTRTLRLMTYNVHSCLGMDGQLSPKRIARVIAQADVDVVALQELDVGRPRSGGIDQAHEIARRLCMDHHFHAALHIEEERYGDAILSRLPMRLIRSDELPFTKPYRERRGAIWVEVTTVQGRPIQIINTHLSLYPNERKQQAFVLTDQWVSAARLKGPVVLCGDFNATPNAPAHRAITRCLQDLHEVAPGPTTATWFSHRPLTRIDHVFASDEVIATHAEVIASDLAKIASDHLPLVVEIEA